MKQILILLLFTGCSCLPKEFTTVPVYTMELLGCNGQVFEKHIIHDFQRNVDDVQWQCNHGLVVYRGSYRVTKH